MFVQMPRHLYGELARTPEGCSLISKARIIETQLACVHNSEEPHLQRRAALWALGHIGATELGCTAICFVDPSFLEWCVRMACEDTNYAMRGAAFQCLGLLSRSAKGSRKLNQLQWLAAPADGNSAVAVPRTPGQLFPRDVICDESYSITAFSSLPARETDTLYPDVAALTASVTPFSSGLFSSPVQSPRSSMPDSPVAMSSTEQEILHLIAKVSEFCS